MDSYQKLNIKWFIFRFLLPKINQKNDLMIRKMRRFEKDKVIFRSIWSEMTDSKSVEVGSIINQRDDSTLKSSNIFCFETYSPERESSEMAESKSVEIGSMINQKDDSTLK